MEQQIKLAIDPEFSKLAWPLTGEERVNLENSLKRDGCHDPIIYWATLGKLPEDCPILDGHNRYAICRRNGIPYQVLGLEFADRNAARNWMILNQLGRRNASHRQKTLLRGQLYIAKLEQSEAAPPGSPRSNVAKEVGEATGVPARQVYRDAAATRALTTLGEVAPAVHEAAMQRNISIGDAILLASEPKETLEELNSKLAAGYEPKTAVQELKRALDTRPILDIKELADLDAALGKLVRAKTAAFTACGGRKSPEAVKYELQVREACNNLAEIILTWQLAFDTRI